MFEDYNDIIFKIIKSASLLDEARLDELNDSRLEAGKSLAESVLDSGTVDRPTFLSAVADYLGYDFIEELPKEIPENVASSVKADIVRMYAIVPYEVDENAITFLARDPFNSSIIDDLTFTLNKEITVVVCDPEHVDQLIVDTYGEETTSVVEVLSDIDSSFMEVEEDLSETALQDIVQQEPIIRFVNLVLEQAVKDKASDVHFEPFEDQFRVRYRIDGALYEMAPPSKNLTIPVISRIKVLANMDISETRIAQDGRIKMTIAGHQVDLRVSSLPTQFGESMVLRILDKSVVNLDLEALSLPDDILQNIREMVARPNGIFIVTGPTGSGKTTTLYSALREVNKVEAKILTVEDPVEYEIDGIMQVSVNHKVGLDFSRALRAFLRQDPDKIMVGEIRDLETAQIAIQASLTGHIVLSTLHTNDASGAVTRLIDMGLEPFLISASLEAVLAQRLVRRICRNCRISYEPNSELIDMLEVELLEIADKEFYYGEGCDHCSQVGYHGRIGLFEMIMVSDALRELINQRSPALAIKQKALEQGMRSLRDDGLRSIFDGQSTIEEILKYT